MSTIARLSTKARSLPRIINTSAPKRSLNVLHSPFATLGKRAVTTPATTALKEDLSEDLDPVATYVDARTYVVSQPTNTTFRQVPFGAYSASTPYAASEPSQTPVQGSRLSSK